MDIVDQKDTYGHRPIDLAVRNNNKEIVHELMQRGATVDKETLKAGVEGIHIYDTTQVVRYILDRKPVETKSTLKLACLNELSDARNNLITLLVQRGASTNTSNRSILGSPLHRIVDIEPKTSDQLRLQEAGSFILCKHGADEHVINSFGEKPIDKMLRNLHYSVDESSKQLYDRAHFVLWALRRPEGLTGCLQAIARDQMDDMPQYDNGKLLKLMLGQHIYEGLPPYSPCKVYRNASAYDRSRAMIHAAMLDALGRHNKKHVRDFLHSVDRVCIPQALASSTLEERHAYLTFVYNKEMASYKQERLKT